MPSVACLAVLVSVAVIGGVYAQGDPRSANTITTVSRAMSDQGEFILRGKILLSPGDRPKRAGLVVVRVEDVSRADAPATTLAEQLQEQVALPQGEGASLPFAVTVPANLIDPRRRYVLRAHVDVDGSRSVTRGDFVSTRSYPVEFREGDARDVTVVVRRV